MKTKANAGILQPARSLKLLSLLLSGLCLCATTSFSQSLHLVSSEPAHMSSGIALSTTIHFSFNTALNRDYLDLDYIHDYIIVRPLHALDIKNIHFSEDEKTISLEVIHKPDTDFVWSFLGLESRSGEPLYPFAAINYSTRPDISLLTVSGSLSYINIPYDDFGMMYNTKLSSVPLLSGKPEEVLSPSQKSDAEYGSSSLFFPQNQPPDPQSFNNDSPSFGKQARISAKSFRSGIPGSSSSEWSPGLFVRDGNIPMSRTSALNLAATQDNPLSWGYALVGMMTDLSWLDDDESDGPEDELVNIAIANPQNGTYRVENVRAGEYYLFAAFFWYRPPYLDAFAFGFYLDDEGEPKKIVISDQSQSGKDITLYGFLEELADPVEASVSFSAALALMSQDHPGARPVHLYGEDSSLPANWQERFIMREPVDPTGKSYFWFISFLDEEEETVFELVMMGSEMIYKEIMHLSDIPEEHLPPVPLSQIASIPDPFVSSIQAVNKARHEGLDALFRELDHHFMYDLEYSLGHMFFEFPDLLNEQSPVFWNIEFNAYSWNPEQFSYGWLQAYFLIDATNGDLLHKEVERYGHFIEPTDLQNLFPVVESFMNQHLPGSEFIQAWSQEEFTLPRFPTGGSREWMLVWFEKESEMINIFNTSGMEISSHESFPLSDIPIEDRPPDVVFKDLSPVPVGSREALATAMEHGLRNQLESVPPRHPVYSRVNYHLQSIYPLYPEWLDENSNPFWDINVSAELFYYDQLVYWLNGNYLVDAFTGEFIGSHVQVSTEQEPELPAQVSLFQNYPNPFNPVTTIVWEMNMKDHVQITVHDLLGREVAMLVNEDKPAGVHSVTFDASGLASGIYLYRLQTGTGVLNRKMTLVK